MLKLHTRKVGDYTDIQIEIDRTRLDLGFHSQKELQVFSQELESALDDIKNYLVKED